MSEPNVNDELPVFERRFADLVTAYARGADQPFDAFAIAGLAAETALRRGPWSGRISTFGGNLRAAWVLLLLVGLMATLVGGAIVLGLPSPAPPAPAFAPDELLIVTGRDQIVAVTLSTGERRVVGEGALMGISPDRTRLVRVPHPWTGRHPVGGRALVVTDAAGSDLGQVPYGAATAAWSPNGRYIAFNHRPEASLEYSVWDTATGTVTRLLGPAPDTGSTPSWAPDSRHVLLSTDRGLVVTDLDGELVQTIPGTDSQSVGTWSPDGAHILHEHITGEGSERLSNSYLELLAVGPGLSTEVVARFEPYISSPSWSPDGRQVAGTSIDGVIVVRVEDLSEFRVVYPRPRVRSEWTALGSDGMGDVEWSPDGRRLTFSAWDSVAEEWAIFGADATGGEATVLMPVGANPVPWDR